jgi:hypothetical protein
LVSNANGIGLAVNVPSHQSVQRLVERAEAQRALG